MFLKMNSNFAFAFLLENVIDRTYSVLLVEDVTGFISEASPHLDLVVFLSSLPQASSSKDYKI